MRELITRAITMAYGISGLFFVRFWKETRDGLFASFAAAFWLLALLRFLQVVLHRAENETTYLF